jgi:hypothetical protein
MNHSSRNDPSAQASWQLRGRRVLGLVLLILTLTPIYRVLDRPDTGSFGVGTIIRGSTHLEAAWWGMILALGVGGLLAWMVPGAGIRALLAGVGRRLCAIPLWAYAWGAGALSAVLAGVAEAVVFHRFPTLVDEMSALLSARALEVGRLALPLPEPLAAWMIPNTLMTPEGWVSQYPPFHPLLLALGYLVSAPWLVGPLLLGVTVALSVLVADHLFPDEPGVGRLGGILLALSPFLIFIGGGYLSHVPAVAFAAVAFYAMLRARDGGWGWAILTGAGAGAMVTTRPWTGLVVTVLYPAALWVVAARRERRWRWFVARAAGATLGGAPFAVGMAWYDRLLFGSPLTLGYALAYGPAHGLGFHRDPWGNLYGPWEALGYSSANLLTLGVYLLETAVPVLALVGLFLAVARRLPRGTGVLLAWALLPVVANFFYWHHGFHLGPRMLYETAPAWLLLAALAALELTRNDVADTMRPRLRPADVALWALLVSLVTPLFSVPLRAEAYRWSDDALARITVPEVPDGSAALIFVHGSWAERISGRLQGGGMRLDSIETALRRNDICRLHRYTMERVARTAGATASAPLPELDFRLLPGAPPNLQSMLLAEGDRVGVDPREPVTPECDREAQADRFGVISLAPLVWQGDLPGAESGRPMFVRDLGPEENEALLADFPGRAPYVFRAAEETGAPPMLVPYAEGMARLWGTATGTEPPPP